MKEYTLPTTSTKEEIITKLRLLKHGECLYFNIFQEGGAVIYCCNTMYLLFEIPLYGGSEVFMNIGDDHNLGELVTEALSWT